MEKLEKTVKKLKKSRRPGISLFLTGGYPTMKAFIELVRFIDRESLADFIEIGVPFSDPVADGPTIQASSKTAIDGGASLRKISGNIRSFRDEVKIPMILMSYLNPLLAGGLEKNLGMVKNAGFSALIIPDLPAGEAPEVMTSARKNGLDIIFLAAPSTGAARIRKIAGMSRPFLYYVSQFGVTGARKSLPAGVSGKLRSVRRQSAVPVYCGFGISDAEQAVTVAKEADGIIIGSALIDMIRGPRERYFKEIRKFAINMRKRVENIR
ncbi:MAG: tryptophan synthase subunit alpha [Elusimicrobia bacterium]|nr:tryptophan synthase subunit alpha [Elusimicrobiota bacterium]